MSKSKQKSEVKKITQFEITRPNVAGIDVSDSEMTVAFPVSSKEIQVRSFGCFTRDLKEIAATLQAYGIESVAMESTGVYWIPLFLLLQEEGFEVCLVNASHTKNVTGRKDDEGDAEWIQKLHRCGLLSASFQPDNWTRTFRSAVRHRSSLVEDTSRQLNRIQKALEQMNIKIHTVLSDIDGVSGRRILDAILAGERDAVKLARLRDRRVKASEEDMIKSLEGCWTEEHLFELKQCYGLYRYYLQMIEECDGKIETYLTEKIKGMDSDDIPPRAKEIKEETEGKIKKNFKKKIKFDAASALLRINGVDVTQITGISELSAMKILAEVGADMSRWKTEKHFAAWLNLAPNNKISGGKIISSKMRKRKSYAGQVFRMAVMSLANSRTPLGDFYRRIRSRAGKGRAIVATAHKLAVIYYKTVSKQEAYNTVSLEQYQNSYRQKKIKRLEAALAKLKAA